MFDDKIIRNEDGAVTVFLTLIFLIMLGLVICVLSAIHDVEENALAEDAADGAGEYVTANYDKELYNRYHIFFMDPREKDQVEADGITFINAYLDSGSYYSFSCEGITLSEENYATDWNGKYLKSEIREYMKYQSVKDGAKALINLAKTAGDDNDETGDLKEELNRASEAEDEEEEEEEEQEETGEENTEVSTDVLKKRADWKSFKEMIEMASSSGTLNFVTANCDSVSGLTIDDDDLPTKTAGSSKAKKILDPDFSFSDVNSFSTLLKGDMNLNLSANLLADEYYVIQYIYDHFDNLTSDEGEDEKALLYEMEYLAGGKASDRDNLQYVVNRLLFIRFATNFSYALGSPSLETEVTEMSLAICGILGLPMAEEAVRYILLAALSYGESMIDVRTLCSGEEVPVMKSEATWNLKMTNIESCFDNSYMSKKGSTNVSYTDYLTVLLLGTVKEKTMYYRMMDLMQENVRLAEDDFCMNDCLFSYVWDVNLICERMFSAIPVFGFRQSGTYALNLRKMITY